MSYIHCDLHYYVNIISRYDCRLHLPSIEALDIACITAESNNQTGNGYDCPAELLEEEMCEEERYKDMHEDIKRLERKVMKYLSNKCKHIKTIIILNRLKNGWFLKSIRL